MRSFYIRRLFRIQPPALTYLAVVSVLILTGELYKLDRYGGSPWSTVLTSILMVRNIFTKTFFFETAHFWSLSVEEQFYIFFPTFLVLCKRYRLAVLTCFYLAANVWRLIYLSKPRPAHIFQRTDLVCAPILLGCVFALALARPRFRTLAQTYLRPSVALSYAVLIFIVTAVHHSRSEYLLTVLMYPLLITATTLHPQSWTTWFLELAPLRYVGRISYSLYLWQELFFDPFAPPPPHTFRSHVLLCWVATFACAIASYYLIERPMIRYGHRVAKKFDLKKQEKSQSFRPTEMAEAG